MKIYKRGDWYHIDVTVRGHRFRRCLETTDWRQAQKDAKEFIKREDELLSQVGSEGFAKLTFAVAAEQYIADRAPNLKELTIRTEGERLRAVAKVLGKTRLSQITVAAVLAYIRRRKAESIANATVNREIDIIRGVLKKAKLWRPFADDVKNLKVEHNIGRALEDHEKQLLLARAYSRPDWEAAFCAAVITLNTTMRGVELKNIQLRDLDLTEQVVRLRRSKTEAGKRSIPLNGPASYAVGRLLQRAQKLGALEPDNYLFYSCEHGKIDTKKPQKSWRSAWRSMTRAVDCPTCGRLQPPSKCCANKKCKADISTLKSPLHGLRFHDLRHCAITELAESQASDSTIRDIAGHVSAQMLKHYSHIRMKARREALEGLARNNALSGYVTNHVTNPLLTEGTAQHTENEVIESIGDNMVELVGIEPTTSSLRTMRSPS